MLLNFPPAGHSALDSEIEKIEKADNISYAEKQKLAIKTAVNKGILILTGGPGKAKPPRSRAYFVSSKARGWT